MKDINELKTLILQKSKERHWIVPFAILVLWTIDSFFSIFFTGFVKFDIPLFISIVIKLGVIYLNLFFLKNMFIENKCEYYPKLKYYAGYAIPLTYVFYSLPRLSWEMKNLVSAKSDFFLWLETFISFLFPLALYIVLWYKKTQFLWGIISERELLDKKFRKEQKIKRSREGKNLTKKILENVDIFVQTIIIVIVIQHFFFQLYFIPSESMVPTFLKKDRTFVSKIQFGPTIPLTKWNLPGLSTPKRGDVIVFESTSFEHKSLFKRIMHQFFFYLTLTTVNLETDEKGEPIKRFLVKRLIGMPGEKIQMIDDKVYIKTENDPDFKLLQIDNEKYSHVELFKEDPEIRRKIEGNILSSNERAVLLKWDEWKKNITQEELIQSIRSEYEVFKYKLSRTNRDLVLNRLAGYFNSFNQDPLLSINGRKLYLDSKKLSLYQDISIYSDPIPILYYYLKLKDKAELENYLFSLNLSNSINNDLSLYAIASRKLNLKSKLYLIENFNIIYDHFSSGNYSSEETNIESQLLERDMYEFLSYIAFYDNRNFPIFPEQGYIPENNYFLMGDNRYNSLDFRYFHDISQSDYRSLDSSDAYSVHYISSLNPYTLPRNRILGKAVLRIWPLNRFGLIK